MKHLFWGIALLLATAATAQPQTTKLPVMRMADPDLYLEIKPHTDSPATPAPAAHPAKAEQAGAEERNLPAEFLLHLAAWEACDPDKYREETGYLFQAEKSLTMEQVEYMILMQRIRRFIAEK
jgi:hypothetical protein